MRQADFAKQIESIPQLKWRVTCKGILVGILSGLLVVLYRLIIEFGTETAVDIYHTLRTQPIYILPWLACAALVGYAIYRLTQWEPCAKGSGIPQVEGIVLFGLKIKWYSVLAVRFIAGTLSSFFGVSLGREGPSIQIGAAGAQMLTKQWSKDKLESNYLITAGAAAGLSAAFNAPLSGIIFSLEEVHRSFSPNVLLAAASAALTADFVSKTVFGLTPVLSYAAIPELPVKYYAWLLLLGVLSGAIGALTNRCLLGISKLYQALPGPLRFIVALLLALPCGLFLPQVLGGGQGLVVLSESATASIAFLLLLLVVKLAFTSTSFGSGLPGGIFMPILAIGALTGAIFVSLLIPLGIPASLAPAFCVCAMAGALSGSVKAPVTSILLMTEMTGSIVHILPVAAVAFTALLTSDLLKVKPIYEELLHRLLDGTSHPMLAHPKRRSIVEIPVEMGSSASGQLVKDVQWPTTALIVAIRRGNEEIVPSGATEILPGDYLIAASTNRHYADIYRELQAICRAK